MYTFEKKEQQGILNIKVSKEEWESAVERSYERNKGKFNIQGFRKGKAPRRVIEQNYGDTVFFDDAFDELVSNEYSKFYDLHNLFYTLNPWLQDICIHPPLTLEYFEKHWAEIKWSI